MEAVAVRLIPFVIRFAVKTTIYRNGALSDMVCVAVDEMQINFMPERGTIDAVFMLRRLQKEYCTRGKKVVYVFCGPRESF